MRLFMCKGLTEYDTLYQTLIAAKSKELAEVIFLKHTNDNNIYIIGRRSVEEISEIDGYKVRLEKGE